MSMASHDIPSTKAARFVTLQHAFHPETVDAIIASTAEKPIYEGASNWGVAWAEATVVVVDADAPVGTDGEGLNGTSEADASEVDATPQQPVAKTTEFEAPFYHGYFIDSAIGLFITAFAVGATLLIELNGQMVYLSAVLLDRVGRLCGIRPLFFLLVVVLLSVDALLLIVSVGVTEILAITTRILTTLSAGCRHGAEWHQYIRKLCILVLWVLRDYHRDWEPERIFPLFRTPHDDQPLRQAHAPAKEEEDARKKAGQPVPQLVIWE